MRDAFRSLLASRWGRVAVAGVVLVAGSVMPSPLRRHPALGTFGPDKALHVVGHAGFASVLADALAGGRRDDGPAALLAVCGSAVLGLVTGYLQGYVPGREAERADLVAGLLGSVLAVLGWRYGVDDSWAPWR